MTGMCNRGDEGLLKGLLIVDIDGELGSIVGVVMKVPTLFARSSSRMSRVASIPSFTGS